MNWQNLHLVLSSDLRTLTMAELNYNPTLPVYAAPNTQAPDATIDTAKLNQETATTVDPTRATVAGQLTGLLAANSPYLQQARAGAMQTANQRGLLNSSIAASAGEEAAIKSALPIAQQDAQLFGNIAQQNAKTIADSLSNLQVGQLEYQKSLANAQITGALTTQEAQKAFEVQRISEAAAMQRQELDAQMKAILQDDQLESAERQQLAATIGTMGNETIGAIERILRDTNIEAKAKQSAIDAIMSNYRANAATAGAVFGLKLTWN